MKNTIQKIILSVLTVSLLLFVGIFAGACDDEKKDDDTPKSALRGTFTYQRVVGNTSDRKLIVTTKLDEAEANPDATNLRLYTNAEPFSKAWDYGNGGQALFSYTINQQLKLNTDFSYTYKYSVLIANPNPWGSEIGKMDVNVSGTFTYEDKGDGAYSVSISNPTGGKQELYGINAGGDNSGYYWHWRRHETPDFVQNFDYSDCFTAYDYAFVGARTFSVNKKEKTLDDNMFLPTLFHEMAKYGTY